LTEVQVYGKPADKPVPPTPTPSETNTTINYTNQTGQVVKSVIVRRTIGSTIDLRAFFPDGYQLTDANTVTVVDYDRTITVQVVPATAELTIRYVDSAGRTVKTQQTTAVYGTDIDLAHDLPDGYVLAETVPAYHVTGDAALTANVKKRIVADFPEQATIHYVPGYGIAVWHLGQGAMHITSKTLTDGTSWRVYGSQIIGGMTWYNVGGNQWIDAQYTKSAAIAVTPIKGTAQINFVPGYGIAVWQVPSKTITSRFLRHGSRWRVLGRTTVGGKTWYNLGGRQWIDGQYVLFQEK
jgi:hypothetical protein